MKTTTNFFSFALLFLAFGLLSVPALAQDNDYWQTRQHQIDGQFGIGLFGLLNDANVDVTITTNNEERFYNATANGSPAASLSYQYRVGKVFSVGPSIGYQTNKITDFRNSEGSQPGVVRVSRYLVGARMLFNYTQRENFELYSGVRTGFTVWRVSTDDFQGTFEFEDLGNGSVAGVIPQITIIPIGAKAFVGEHLSLGGEIALGSPHFAAVNVGYRF